MLGEPRRGLPGGRREALGDAVRVTVYVTDMSAVRVSQRGVRLILRVRSACARDGRRGGACRAARRSRSKPWWPSLTDTQSAIRGRPPRCAGGRGRDPRDAGRELADADRESRHDGRAKGRESAADGLVQAPRGALEDRRARRRLRRRRDHGQRRQPRSGSRLRGACAGDPVRRGDARRLRRSRSSTAATPRRKHRASTATLSPRRCNERPERAAETRGSRSFTRSRIRT